jgi:GNAT superfamily N-acetyltransferase
VTSPVTVRAFVPEDIDVVIELLQDVSAYRPPADTVLLLAKTFAVQPNCYACVAVQDGRPIGFGSVFFLNRLRGGVSASIEDVVVAESFRGRGLGQNILSALLDAARVRGSFKVTLEASPSAEKFYCAAGFVKAGGIMKFML